jgi:hypothetical protein
MHPSLFLCDSLISFVSRTPSTCVTNEIWEDDLSIYNKYSKVITGITTAVSNVVQRRENIHLLGVYLVHPQVIQILSCEEV